MQYFRHYKGNFYRLIGEARHSETLDAMIVYQALYRHTDDGKTIPAPEGAEIWVRPKEMFFETVTLPDGNVVPRFAEVTEEEFVANINI